MNRNKKNGQACAGRLAGRLCAAVLALAAAAAAAEPRPWMLLDGSSLMGEYRMLRDGKVVIALEGGGTNAPDFEALQPADQTYVADRERAMVLPPAAPPWEAGYKARYVLRLAGEPGAGETRTVLASLPTGGWLKPDASDLLVKSLSGRTLSCAVLAHDPRGRTIIQFNRLGQERWYWVYAVNPAPKPLVDPALRRRLAETGQARDQARLDMMTLQKASADAAERLREHTDSLNRARQTAAAAAREIEAWEKLLPAKLADVEKANAAEPAAGTAVEAARAADQAAAAEAAAVDPAAPPEQTLPVRVRAAQARTNLENAEKELAAVRRDMQRAAGERDQARQAIAAARTLRDQSAAESAKLEPGLPPLQAAADQARARSAASVENTRTLEERHRALAGETDPTVHQEGLTAEFREWRGDQLDELSDWAVVVRGLEQSENVLGNAIVTEVLQNVNPFRPADPRNYAVSYRGFLRIEKSGIYRFFVNGDDAAFLFINGFKVYSRVGSNTPVRGRVPLYALGADMELEAGDHPFEVHQAVGNTPGAQGLCTLMWLTPGAKEWRFVPASAFTRAGHAVVTAVEGRDGNPAPTVEWGMDDALAAGGTALYLARFEAGGATDRQACNWVFGDGQSGRGRSRTHVYFKEGDYEVSVQGHPDLPPFRRRIHVWTPPTSTSPFSLSRAVEALALMDTRRLDEARLFAAFDFLRVCGQTNRWPVLERVAGALLAQGKPDAAQKTLLLTTRMEALARSGRAADGLALMDAALAAAGRVQTLQAEVLFRTAEVYRHVLRDFDRAGELYGRILEEHRRLRHPAVRAAAAAWGDMYLEAENMARAADCYRLAASLDRPGGGIEGGAEAATRGALLRVAEQQLKGGNIRQTWRLLDRIEQDHPEQKLEGLYRYLRGESDRHGGRYEEAIRHYEVLLKLRQWAAYRPQALLGIADALFRLGLTADALAGWDALKDAFPAFYTERGLDAQRGMAEARLAREQAALAAGEPATPPLAEGHAPFSREEPPPRGARYRFLPSLGIDGTDTLFYEVTPDSSSQFYGEPLSPAASGGRYWVEFWYRNAATPPIPVVGPHVHIRLHGSDNVMSAQQTVTPDRSYGEWQKMAARLQAPLTPDARWSLQFVYLNGFHEIDGVRVRPVTDAQEEALRVFIEGEGP